MRLGAVIATVVALAVLAMGARWLRSGRGKNDDNGGGTSQHTDGDPGASSRVHPYDQEPEA